MFGLAACLFLLKYFSFGQKKEEDMSNPKTSISRIRAHRLFNKGIRLLFLVIKAIIIMRDRKDATGKRQEATNVDCRSPVRF